MKDTLFLSIPSNGQQKTFGDLLRDLNSLCDVPEFIYTDDPYHTFLYIVAAACNHSAITLTDAGLSDFELSTIGLDRVTLGSSVPRVFEKYQGIDEVLESMKNNVWTISLFTSGTTGKPKKIIHTISTFLRSVRVGDKFANNVWGMCYHPTHIAGLSVLFQALFNKNPIIFLFNLDQRLIKSSIKEFGITHLSATPSFYRQLLPATDQFQSVVNLTSGGEKFDENLMQELKQVFVNAKFKNIYASTEAGTIFVGNGNIFSVKTENLQFVKIVDNRLFLHASVVGTSDGISSNEEWYDTGDIVEVINISPLEIKFISRQNDFVNVGGFKVNPLEVEEIIRTHPNVKNAKVFGKKNSILGNILVAEIQLVMNGSLDESNLREYLIPMVQDYKIPRLINFVSDIEMTRTGKIARK